MNKKHIKLKSKFISLLQIIKNKYKVGSKIDINQLSYLFLRPCTQLNK